MSKTYNYFDFISPVLIWKGSLSSKWVKIVWRKNNDVCGHKHKLVAQFNIWYFGGRREALPEVKAKLEVLAHPGTGMRAHTRSTIYEEVYLSTYDLIVISEN